MKRRTFSQRHYLAVIRGDFKVLMRYAMGGEPKAPNPRSLVGMSQSQRKRKARELAFFRVKQSIQRAYAAQAETLQARERGEDVVSPWDRHYQDHPFVYRQARQEYRIGERLRPCPGCLGCCAPIPLHPQLLADARKVGIETCDGSGVLPAKRRAGGGR